MPSTMYPQLHDPDFLVRTRELTSAELADQLGCAQKTVDWYRRLLNTLHSPDWSDVDVEFLSCFYGDAPTAYIAQGLRRAPQDLYNCARQLGLDGAGAPPASDEARATFWPDWQAHIEENVGRWSREGHLVRILELLWRPYTRFAGSCPKCDHLDECCQLNTEHKPVACERLTIREWLRDYHGIALPDVSPA